MRPETTVDGVAETIDQIHVFTVEEAVLQTNVDVVAKRSADAGQDLPCEAGIRIIETGRVAEADLRGGFGASNAHTTAGEALKAIIRTEIEQAVDHEAQRADVARSGIDAGERDTGCGQREALQAHIDVVDVRFAIAGFGFEAHGAEIVADEAAEIVAHIRVDREVVCDPVDVEFDVLDDHRTTFDLHVERVITCKRRRCEHRRSHRHSNDDIAHY